MAFIGNRGEANIFLSNLRKTFFDKVQNNSLSKMIVYSLGLFGLLWTSSDFFGHLVIFFGPFFDFLDVSPGSLGAPAIVTRF